MLIRRLRLPATVASLALGTGFVWAQAPITIPTPTAIPETLSPVERLTGIPGNPAPMSLPKAEAPAPATTPAPATSAPTTTTTIVDSTTVVADPGATTSTPCPTCSGTGCDACNSTGYNFKNVPPALRPPVRAGMFGINPTGKGYYSLFDRLQGNEREAAPKYPYPPFVTSTLPFYDADWRFVDDPKYTPDALDRLKRIHLGDNWLLSTGGQAWVRFNNEYNSRLGQVDNSYMLNRVRPYLDLWYQDKFRFFIEGMFAQSSWQDLPPVASDVDQNDIQNLFIDVKLTEIMGKPVYVRAGRQELQLGSQRLVATPDFANTRTTFDGVRVLRNGEKWNTDLFWLRPRVINQPGQLNGSDNNQNFAGAWATYKPKAGTIRDFYYLMLDNSNRTTQQGVQRSPFTVHTIGTRWAGDKDGRFLYDIEGALQFGDLDHRNIFAGMFTSGVGYHWKDTAWNPILWAYYDYASGDKNPNIGNANTFNQLFPFGHYYMGYIDVVGRKNIHDVNFTLWLYPSKWLTLQMQQHNFWLDSSKDALYNAAGNAFRRDPTGKAGTFVGSELDLLANFHLTRRADFFVGYSYLWGGEFLRNTASSANAVNTSYTYCSYSYRW